MKIIEELEKRKRLLSYLNSPSNSEVYTPVALVEEMLDKLSVEIWKNPNFQWVDPCAKSGVFILEVIIRLMKNLKIGDETFTYNHIINNMVKAYVNVERNKWLVSKIVYGNSNNISKIELLEIDKIKENMPKFDVVVGNPPYKKNLHLQFLQLAVNMLNENGEIIWIHPARWLQDATAPMKKNSDFNKYHNLPFVKFDVIPIHDAQKYFNNLLTSDLIISYLKNNKESILDEDKIYELRSIPISLKRLFKINFTTLNSVIEFNKKDGIRVKVRPIIPFIGSGAPENPKIEYYTFFKNDIIINGLINGKDWTEYGQRNQFSKPIGSTIPQSIKFDTINDAKNFIDSTNTDVFLFFNYLTKLDVNVQFKYLPFMNDYKEPWTNERFQQYFNLSDEELKFIKNIMKKYK